MERISKKKLTSKQISSIILNVSLKALAIIMVIAAMYIFGYGAYKFSYKIANDTAVESAPGRDVRVVIETGMSLNDIAELLEEKGLINNKLQFVAHVKLNKHENELYSGVYTLNTSETTSEMLGIIKSSGEKSTEESE